jgi:DNA polymerase/3'-5' exonuclease PolX
VSTSTAERLPLADAEHLALQVVELLRPACERIEIAGSIRRRKETCGDIEVVCIPKLMESRGTDLFGMAERPEVLNLLDMKCKALLDSGDFSPRYDKNGRGAFGERYKRLSFGGFPLDLFSVLPPAQWGVVFLIRTGSAEFSHHFVMSRDMGGLLPRWARIQDGALRHKDGSIIETPEEADVFRAIGQPYVEPEARS